MIPPIDVNLKDWIQAISWSAAVVVAIITAAKYFSEQRQNREQRDRDLRWRQADAGKKLNDEMLDNTQAWDAMQMLDYSSRSFEISPGTWEVVTEADYLAALDPGWSETSPKVIYIRDCFDCLFYYMAALEHYISNSLVRQEDVEYPLLSYYVPILSRHRSVIQRYLEQYRLTAALAFLERFTVWRDAPRATPSTDLEPANDFNLALNS